jgi:hypothetical protein
MSEVDQQKRRAKLEELRAKRRVVTAVEAASPSENQGAGAGAMLGGEGSNKGRLLRLLLERSGGKNADGANKKQMLRRLLENSGERAGNAEGDGSKKQMLRKLLESRSGEAGEGGGKRQLLRRLMEARSGDQDGLEGGGDPAQIRSRIQAKIKRLNEVLEQLGEGPEPSNSDAAESAEDAEARSRKAVRPKAAE